MCVQQEPTQARVRFGPDPAAALPAQLVHQLIHDLGVPEGEIVGMTLESATKLMIAYWSQPQGQGRVAGGIFTLRLPRIPA